MVDSEVDEFAEIAAKAAANLIEDVLSACSGERKYRRYAAKLQLSFKSGLATSPTYFVAPVA